MIFKFYLHPTLVPDMQFAKTQLAKYVQDMNAILAKNTTRQLEFNPETDIILTESNPHTNTYFGDLPLDFEIWAHAVKMPGASNNGYMGIDQSGAGVLAGLRWNKIHNPDDPQDAYDYGRQLHFMLHELAHVFGAGMGEYYAMKQVGDVTELPSAAIDFDNPLDPFWSVRGEYLTDPLLVMAAELPNVTRAVLVNHIQYAPVTAHIISGNYRNGIPTPNPVIVRVRHGQTPLRNARVKVWRVDCNPPHAAELVEDVLTDVNGLAGFYFGNGQRNSNTQLRFVKVYKGGYSPQAKAVSVHDADKVTLIDLDDYQMDFDLARQPSFADVPDTHSAYAAIEAIADAGITSGCGGGNFCPNSTLTRAQAAVWISKALGLT
jgi:hypothetical protein